MKFGHAEYVGFLDPGKTGENTYVPCCFKIPKQKKATYGNCVNKTCLEKEIEPVQETVKSNPLYVFTQDKRKIEKDRYAFLPKDIEVFSQH